MSRTKRAPNVLPITYSDVFMTTWPNKLGSALHQKLTKAAVIAAAMNVSSVSTETTNGSPVSRCVSSHLQHYLPLYRRC